MTATQSERTNWGELTEVEEETIEEVVFSMDGDSTDRVDVEIKCIKPGPNGWKFHQFVETLHDYFHTYVLPPSVRADTPEFRWHRKARKKAAPNENFESGGVVSEFLLYLFTEAYLDAPLAAHRLYELDSRNQEKKGSDGLFVGRHRGEECLYVGEAKFYDSIASAIEDAFDSISEFHTRGVNDRMERELELASTDFAEKTDSLSTDEVEALANRLSPRAHEDYKIVHPLFLGHETARLDWYPNPGPDVLEFGDDSPPREQQIEDELKENLREIPYLKRREEKASELGPARGTVEMVFFPFPVHDTTEFKRLLYEGLFNPENA
ncbi:HamA C-terminal domain-containing protein [Halorussus ruber]|uniref:HamA C-terminal domain-containing protein n=1 Tax=Halorussus ruber TaxID=1126238 RepID=UPI001092EF49|nr:DUF1837 domain-containing protein [Halorussus ruber]